MKTWLRTRFNKITSALGERWHLVLENLALHHQIAVLNRSAKRPQFSHVDRRFWILLSIIWSRWQGALKIAQADTVRRWRRQGWWNPLGWRQERKRPGRPPIPVETQQLIRRMSPENGTWGAPRIHSEPALLGINLSQTTVAKYMDRCFGPPSQTWRTFWNNHIPHLIDSVPSSDLMPNWQARFAQVVQAIGRWPNQKVQNGIRWLLGHPDVNTRSMNMAPVLRVRMPPVMKRIQTSERSPPAPVSSLQRDDVAKSLHWDLLTSEVHSISSAIVYRDQCFRRRGPSRHHAMAKDTGLSQRKAA